MKSKIIQRKPCLIAKVSTKTITLTRPGLKRVSAVRSRRLTDVCISLPYVNSTHYLAENILLPTRSTVAVCEQMALLILLLSSRPGVRLMNLWQSSPKMALGIHCRTVPIVFISFAQPASLYCELYIYIYINK